MRPYLKKKKILHRKRAGRVVQGIGPEFKPQYCKKREGEIFTKLSKELCVKKTKTKTKNCVCHGAR
jgi:hypothetical protein